MSVGHNRVIADAQYHVLSVLYLFTTIMVHSDYMSSTAIDAGLQKNKFTRCEIIMNWTRIAMAKDQRRQRPSYEI